MSPRGGEPVGAVSVGPLLRSSRDSHPVSVGCDRLVVPLSRTPTLREMRSRSTPTHVLPGVCGVGYLVDPASSHMLVSKIKPCMSKYEPLYKVKLRMAH